MAAPVALVLAWEAADGELHDQLPQFVLSVLRCHEQAFGRRAVSVSVGLREHAQAVQAVTENWKRS